MLGAIVYVLGILVLIYFLFLRDRRKTYPPSSFRKAEKKQNPKVPLQTFGTLSLQQVSLHNSRDDLWLIIDDKVYDFSSFVADHPGGDAILRYAGSDASVGFKGPQHPSRVWDMIPHYYIGDLDRSAVVFFKVDLEIHMVSTHVNGACERQGVLMEFIPSI
eukprot:jgi/Galph1/3656/GphlegSOOS_G2375.1